MPLGIPFVFLFYDEENDLILVLPVCSNTGERTAIIHIPFS